MLPLKILHTSDWHLGQHFMGKSRGEEHAALIKWLTGQVQALAIDVVIIAGDLFDTGSPPSYARELYNQLILAVRDAGAELVLLGGNHDSVSVLSESKLLLQQLGTRVVASVSTHDEADLLPLHNRQGEVAGLLCAIPYIRPHDVVDSLAGQSGDEKQRSLQQAIAAHYARLYQLADEQRHAAGRRLPIIATGHLTTVGASCSESVREIYVGTLEAFPANAFPPADYIALGHIHRPQTVGKQPHIRYCGSPIPLAFDEAGQQKQVNVVSLNDAGLIEVKELPVPCFRPLRCVRGSLDELTTAIPEIIRSLTSAKEGPDAAISGISSQAQTEASSLSVWLEVVVRADDYLSDLQPRIAAIVDVLPAGSPRCEVLRIRRERSTRDESMQQQARETLAELDVLEVFQRRLALEDIDPSEAQMLADMYKEVVAEVNESGGAVSAGDAS